MVLEQLLFAALSVALLCFVVGYLTGNCSQVDKLWSILPIGYAWYVAYSFGFTGRLTLMAMLATIWGARLTYNFSRRGGYSWKFWTGEEDYRWEVLRENTLLKGSKTRWFLFHLGFICLCQNALILFFTLPILVTANATDPSISLIDLLLAGLLLVFVVIETIADQQQWNFQQEKTRLQAGGRTLPEAYAKGFVSSGLWRLVRHPNYAAEQSIWIVFYFFSVVACRKWINWSMAGCLSLLLLFRASSDFSEGISAKKYPAYADYKRKTGRFVPRLF